MNEADDAPGYTCVSPVVQEPVKSLVREYVPILPRSAFGGATTMQQQQQLQQHCQQRWQQLQRQQPHQQQTEPRRNAPKKKSRMMIYKSCTFCARRKRRCDGDGRHRCSFCVEKDQQCIYRPKPRDSSRGERQPKLSGGTAHSANLSAARCPLGTGYASGRSVALKPDVASASFLSLKRCRMSPSPATGFIGMQENAYLSDFFGCLGFLPLTTESTVRRAMVEVMLGHALYRQHQRRRDQYDAGVHRAEKKRTEAGGEMYFPTSQSSSGGSSACLMWCAVALGALVQGSPLQHVSRYVTLARNSLRACFDADTVDTARAYLVMSFLQSFLGDQERKKQFLNFAMSVVKKLPKTQVLQELGDTLLASDTSKLFQDTTVRSRDLEDYCRQEYARQKDMGSDQQQRHHFSTMDIVNSGDICRILLVNDRRQKSAFLADLSARNTPPSRLQDLKDGDDIREPTRSVSADKVEMFGMEVIVNDRHRSGESRPIDPGDGGQHDRSGVDKVENQFPFRKRAEKYMGSRELVDTPQAGAATRSFMRKAMPLYLQLSNVAEGSGKMSGVGGLFFHGDIGYMNAVMGQVREAVERTKICAGIMKRYPGICRFMPHLVHCALMAAAWSGHRSVYNSMRAAYNSNQLAGFLPAPPIEEWTDMTCVCGHVFCRSVEAEVAEACFTFVGHPFCSSSEVESVREPGSDVHDPLPQAQAEQHAQLEERPPPFLGSPLPCPTDSSPALPHSPAGSTDGKAEGVPPAARAPAGHVEARSSASVGRDVAAPVTGADRSSKCGAKGAVDAVEATAVNSVGGAASPRPPESRQSTTRKSRLNDGGATSALPPATRHVDDVPVAIVDGRPAIRLAGSATEVDAGVGALPAGERLISSMGADQERAGEGRQRLSLLPRSPPPPPKVVSSASSSTLSDDYLFSSPDPCMTAASIAHDGERSSGQQAIVAAEKGSQKIRSSRRGKTDGSLARVRDGDYRRGIFNPISDAELRGIQLSSEEGGHEVCDLGLSEDDFAAVADLLLKAPLSELQVRGGNVGDVLGTARW